MKYPFYIACIFFGLIVSSCNSKKVEENKHISAQQHNIPTVQIQTMDSPKGNQNYPISNKPLKPEQLEQFLPKNINGMKKSIPEHGYQNWNGKPCATASCEFTFPGGGMIISIKDYGNYSNIPDFEINDFKKYGENSTKEFQKVSISNGIAFMRWNDNSRTGILEAMVANRFTIRMDATNLPSTSLSINNLYPFINTDGMIALAEKLKNKNLIFDR